MAITIACNLLAALLDGFAIALLIPFLNILFHQPSTSLKSGWVAKLLNATVGSQIIPGDEMRSLRNVILLVMVSVLLKNLLVWIAGQFGATLQEYVTRDLRNAVYRHLAHLPLGYFTQMKAGQILSRVINDTFETRLILTQIVTQSLQSASLVLVYIAILFSISWKLSLIALVILPLLGVSLQPMLKKLRRGNLRRGNVHGRNDERAAGDDQRHPSGEGVGHRELRGIEIRRRKQQVRAQQSQADASGAAGSAGHRDHRHSDRGAHSLDRGLAGVERRNDDRRDAARVPHARAAPAPAAQAALADADHRAVVARVGRETVRDPGFAGGVPARSRDEGESGIRARPEIRGRQLLVRRCARSHRDRSDGAEREKWSRSWGRADRGRARWWI